MTTPVQRRLRKVARNPLKALSDAHEFLTKVADVVGAAADVIGGASAAAHHANKVVDDIRSGKARIRVVPTGATVVPPKTGSGR